MFCLPFLFRNRCALRSCSSLSKHVYPYVSLF
jgi:hypothetical protein